MSGSSLDGIDLICVDFKNAYEYSILNKSLIPYPDHISSLLADILYGELDQYFQKQALYSKFIANTILQYIDTHNLKIDKIASHGHTLVHNPPFGYSVQIGDGAIISAITGIDTICDFRTQDVTLGGQGAPIVPILEKELFNEYKLFLNLGGIANLSYHKSSKEIFAFDVCACNQVLNHFSLKLDKEFDDKGSLAASGKFDDSLYHFLDQHPYYIKDYPKTLDNQYVYSEFIYPIPDVIPNEDILHTYCHLVAKKVHQACHKLSIHNEKILLTGGGTHNDFLFSLIAKELKKLEIVCLKPSDELIDFKEALLMAYMGFLFSIDKENTLASATGASRNWISGALYKGTSHA